MSKKIITITVLVLAVMMLVFAYLNAGSVEEKKQMEEDQVFNVIIDEVSTTVSMSDLEKIGIVEFIATVDTSTTDPHDVSYMGVELKDILEYKELEVSDKSIFELRALDGYSSALTYDEVMTDENVYITTHKEGESLGTKSEGGEGPFMMIVKSSNFSQRWCKFMQEVVVK